MAHQFGHHEETAETLAMIALAEAGSDPPPCCCNPRIIVTPLTIVVDPINGKDDGSAFPPSGPIKTIAKLNNLLCNTIIDGSQTPVLGNTVTVVITSDIPATDDALDLTIRFRNMPDFGTAVAIMGSFSQTIVKSGTFTAVTPINPVANQPEIVADAVNVADWSHFPSLGIVVTGPAGNPRIGNFAWITAFASPANLAQAITSAPSTPGVGPDPNGFQVGDQFAIVIPTRIRLTQVTVYGDGSRASSGLSFTDLDFPNPTSFTSLGVWNNFAGSTGIFAQNCHFGAAPTLNGSSAQVNSSFLNGFSHGEWLFIGGMMVPSGNQIADAVTVSDGFMVNGFPYLVGNSEQLAFSKSLLVLSFFSSNLGLQLQDCGAEFFGFPVGGCLVISEGATVTSGPGGTIWGTSTDPTLNTGTVGVEISGGTLELLTFFGAPPMIPLVTGTGGFVGVNDNDLVIGFVNAAGQPTARAWDESAGAYTAPIVSTWANFAVPIPAGFLAPASASNPFGLGTNAQDVATGNRVIQTSFSGI
jgi:hypothetical protein